jgi:hypothetical protein
VKSGQSDVEFLAERKLDEESRFREQQISAILKEAEVGAKVMEVLAIGFIAAVVKVHSQALSGKLAGALCTSPGRIFFRRPERARSTMSRAPPSVIGIPP